VEDTLGKSIPERQNQKQNGNFLNLSGNLLISNQRDYHNEAHGFHWEILMTVVDLSENCIKMFVLRFVS
jgi:hypothetical protein